MEPTENNIPTESVRQWSGRWEDRTSAVAVPGGPAADAPKRRVLIVDDNQDAATTLAMLLKLIGNDVHACFDGQAGVEAAERLRPQVVILDISMPVMDGYQACRFIREQPWGKSIVLIALSGYGQDDDIQRSTEVGFDAHLVKPVDLPTLKKLIASVPTAG